MFANAIFAKGKRKKKIVLAEVNPNSAVRECRTLAHVLYDVILRRFPYCGEHIIVL